MGVLPGVSHNQVMPRVHGSQGLWSEAERWCRLRWTSTSLRATTLQLAPGSLQLTCASEQAGEGGLCWLLSLLSAVWLCWTGPFPRATLLVSVDVDKPHSGPLASTPGRLVKQDGLSQRLAGLASLPSSVGTPVTSLQEGEAGWTPRTHIFRPQKARPTVCPAVWQRTGWLPSWQSPEDGDGAQGPPPGVLLILSGSSPHQGKVGAAPRGQGVWRPGVRRLGEP